MIDLSQLKDTTFLLTGITGYIGSEIVKELKYLNCIEHLNISVVAVVRDVEKAKDYHGTDAITYIYSDMCDEEQLSAQMQYLHEKGIDYLIHCAAPTKSSYMVSNPVETANTIVLGTKNMLEIARKLRVKSMVYLSSMEVYGSVNCVSKDGTLLRITEEQLGDIDITSPRSCYPLGKRMAEHYCFAYHQEYNVPIKVARLAQTFGRGVQLDNTKVFAQFAHSVIEGKDIVLHTTGASMGNYVDIDDAVEAIFTILFMGENGEAYNVVNEANTMSINEMAELVAGEIADGKLRVCYDIPKTDTYSYAAPTGLRLSSEKLRRLGWKPEYSLTDMYKKMMNDMYKEVNRMPNVKALNDVESIPKT